MERGFISFILGLLFCFQYILSIIRERALVLEFGLSADVDLYLNAFKVPTLFFTMISSFVASTVLVPTLIKTREEEGDKKFSKASSHIFSCFIYCLIAFFAIFAFFLEDLILLVISILGIEIADLATFLLLNKIILVSQIFLLFSIFFTSYLQVYERFYSFAISTIFYNLALIFSIYVATSISDIAWGVFYASLLHLAVPLFKIIQLKLMPKLVLKLDFNLVLNYYKTASPRVLVNYLFLLPTTVLYTFWALNIAEGSAFIISFAIFIISMFSIIIGYTNLTTSLPILSKKYYSGDLKFFYESLIKRSRVILLLSWLIFAFGLIFIYDLLFFVLGNDSLESPNILIIAIISAAFLLCLKMKCLIFFYMSVFYIIGKNKISVYLFSFSILANFILFKIFSNFFLSSDFKQMVLKYFAVDEKFIPLLIFPFIYLIITFILYKSFIFILNKEYHQFAKEINFQGALIVMAIIPGFFVALSLNMILPANIILSVIIPAILGLGLTFYLLFYFKHTETLEMVKFIRQKYVKG